jgi:predicted dehydrogenase
LAIDYGKLTLAQKAQKVARYVGLYGPLRTLEKVRAQRHMQGDPAALPARWDNPRPAARAPGDVAIVGCGNFAFSTIAYYCARAEPGFLRGCYDPAGARAISLCRRYGGRYAAADPEELIADPQVRLVFVASNHASHAEYAISALRAGKDVHIEKPHVVTEDQLTRLQSAMRDSPGSRVFLGFNRPRSPHFRRLRAWLDAESGPLMINWFVAGHAIPDGHWYFSEAEGGRVLGNLCHWTDLTLEMVGRSHAFPARAIPATFQNSKSDFALAFDFADGSVASITFSAKGNTFEGVREYLNVHRGDALISMRDFQISTLHRGAHRETFRSRFRDHGHGANIVNSLRGREAASLEAMSDSARLFLAAREAIEQHRTVTLLPLGAAEGLESRAR